MRFVLREMAVLFVMVTATLAQTAPFPPTYIIVADPTNEGSDHRGSNLITSRNVTFEWEHTCSSCDYELYLDGDEPVIVSGHRDSKYQFTLLDVSVGDHHLEIRATNDTPCPPANQRPTGCSRYFAFTVMTDGTIIAAPQNLRILPVNPPGGPQ